MASSYTQIYPLINEAAKEAFGAQAPQAKDTASFLTMGKVVLSSSTNTTQWYGAIQKKIARVLTGIKEGVGKRRKIRRDELAWGAFIEKVHVRAGEAQENHSWNNAGDDLPVQAGAVMDEVEATIFGGKVGTWNYKKKRPSRQLYEAWQSEAQMDAFLTALTMRTEIDMEMAWKNLDTLALSTNMAVAINKGGAQFIDILAKANAFYGLTGNNRMTPANCLADPRYHKVLVMELMKTHAYMVEERTQLYNAEALDTRSYEEDLIMEVLKDVAVSAKVMLQSDTYHDNLVKLPGYEEVNYWQAPGVNNFAFADTSKINITHEGFVSESNPTGNITQDNIVAFLHDVNSCASIIHDIRDYSYFDPDNEKMIVWKKGDKEFMVDPYEQAVVFYNGALA